MKQRFSKSCKKHSISCIHKLWFYFLSLSILVIILYLLIIRPHLLVSMSTVPIELGAAVVILLSFCITLLYILISLIIILIISLCKHKASYIKSYFKKGYRKFILAGAFAFLLIIATVSSQFLVYTPPIVGTDGKPIKNSIASVEKINVNGRNEWITLRGKNKSNPVLLFLAGGPGGTQLSASRRELSSLEDNFVVIDWDQPGSGKSYNAIDTTKLTLNDYISDAHALTKYLCKRFNQNKIYVVGQSWGSYLGVMLVKQYPKLFHAFIGTGQMVSFSETETYDYNKALEIAHEKGDTKKISELKKQGPPQYYGKNMVWKEAAYSMYLSDYMAKNPDIYRAGYNTPLDIGGPEYGLIDKVNWVKGPIYTFNNVYQKLYNLDLRKQALKIDVPVFFLEGRYDINAPTKLAEDYYNKLDAPQKDFIWFEHSGHDPWINERDRFVSVVNDILDMTK